LLLPPGRNSVLIRLGPQGFHKDEIVGDWTVTVKAATLPIPYAEVMDDPLDQGLKERWFELEKDSTGQHSDKVWLSPMNCSLREWNANPNDKGLEQVFPPEHAHLRTFNIELSRSPADYELALDQITESSSRDLAAITGRLR